MAENSGLTLQAKSERLKFIDMARSIAIILMLQGHFITLTYEQYTPLCEAIRTTGNSGNLLFDWWIKIRGFTAPLFFTITGMVFVYLLIRHDKTSEQKIPFIKNHRVRKGFKRCLTILLWAYALQLNFKYLPYYLKGHLNSELFAFHILQAIAFGLFSLILLYGLYRWIRIIHLTAYYFVAGSIVFLCYPYFHHLTAGTYFPLHAPEIIQNIFHGPKSEFPIIPWVGFVLFGGMLGSMIHHFQHLLEKRWFPFATVLFGIVIYFYGRFLGKLTDHLFAYFHPNEPSLHFERNAWVYGRLAEALLLLSVLMIIERLFKIRNSLFLKMGQNTLPIYIAHVIILYGAITGYSLKDLFRTEFSGLTSCIGAGLFILLFAVFIRYIEWLNEKLNWFRKKFRKKSGNVFKVNTKA